MLKEKVRKYLPIEAISFKRFIKDLALNGLVDKKTIVNKSCECVVFLIQFPETWPSCKSVYDAFVNRGIDTYILCIPKFTMVNSEKILEPTQDRENEAYNYFIESGYLNCIRADQDDSTWYQLEKLNPDIAIYTRPYNSHYPACYKSNNINYCLTGYIPYGYNVLSGSVLNGMFNNDFIRNIDKCFVCNKSTYDYLMRYLFWYRKFGNLELINLGYPRFDLIKTRNKSNQIKTVTWLPRWVSGNITGEQKGSHFLEYYNDFLNYAEKNRSLDFIIRPHPLMFSNFIETGAMTEDEINNFMSRCSQIPNVKLDRSPEYLPLLESTDILIADVTALMVEFYYANVSIIYCDETTNFSKEVLQMSDLMYKANNWEKIVSCIDEIINYGDRYREERENNLSKERKYATRIGESIAEFLLKSYLKGDS